MTLYPVIRAGFVNLERNLEIAKPAPNRGGSHVTQDPMRAVGMPTNPTVSLESNQRHPQIYEHHYISVMLRSLLSLVGTTTARSWPPNPAARRTQRGAASATDRTNKVLPGANQRVVDSGHRTRPSAAWSRSVG